MARPTSDFTVAWNALSGQADEAGWRCIALAPAGSCLLMAGRRFPGNEESLLCGFMSAGVPPADSLPEGYGFSVSRADPQFDGRKWLGLTRRQSGSQDLFVEMVADVAGAMDAAAPGGEERVLRTLLGRVRLWQEFMRSGSRALGPEAEVGLLGELQFLGLLLDAGLDPGIAVDGWVGQLGGVQDFEIGHGAVEVKSSLSSQGFPAKIGSLDQLDDAVRKPLFLAGVKFLPSAVGLSLPDAVSAVRNRVDGDQVARHQFEDRLLASGYLDSHADRYTRRFAVQRVKLVEVTLDFPRLVSGNVPRGVRKVSYEIDLDVTTGDDVPVINALIRLGAV